MLVHASLFSGIGGFDLAAEWMGWDNLFHCEWNPFGQRVLKHHFPNSISYNDITKTNFSIHRGQVDILTGGFPCQPYSLAGKRLGKEDERHLFPEMLRAIQEVQPRWIVGENVLGIVNWGGGMVFEEVQTFMEAEGYEVQTYVLPAAGKNAPHKRDRVWFVAYSKCYKNKHSNNRRSKQKERNLWWENERNVSNTFSNNGNATDTDTSRIHEQYFTSKSNKSEQFSRFSFERRDFSRFPTKSPICGGDDGISRELDGITFSKWRNESIKAYGNAIVPQVAYEIFKAIQEFELMVNK
jgi:DNA (cytosine-5)-methyltransferase 1